MVGLGHPELSVRVGAREFDVAAIEPREQVLESSLVGPGDVRRQDRWKVLRPGVKRSSGN